MTHRMAGFVKDVGERLFAGYAELLRMPHAARFSIGSVIASMPLPMFGMTVTITVQRYYGSYALAGALTGVQAIALALATPLLGKLVDKFGQRQVSIPTVIVWTVAAVALITAITRHAPVWLLYAITPLMAAIPPWGAMSRARWAYLLKDDRVRVDRALGLSGAFDECMWVVGNPLGSVLAVISGVLAFSATGLCVLIGAAMFLTELSTEPPSQTQLARTAGMTRKEYRRREASAAGRMQGEKRGESIWSAGLIAVCASFFGLGAFESAANISIIAFARQQSMEQLTGFVFACFSFSSLLGAIVYGSRNWVSPLWKRFYLCLAVVNLGTATFLFATTLWQIMVIYLLIGICQSPTWINGNQLMLHMVPPARFTEGVSWLGAMSSIGASAGSAVAGVYIDGFGPHGGFATVTVMALSSLAIALIGFRQIKSSTEKPVLTAVHVTPRSAAVTGTGPDRTGGN